MKLPSLALLVERTEGWAAGVRLAALSLAGHPEPARFAEEFSGSERTVADYLLAEVLDRQSEPVRRLLLRTSVLERVSGELADLLTGRSGGGERGEGMLQDLEQADAFVVALDARRSWFARGDDISEITHSQQDQDVVWQVVPCRRHGRGVWKLMKAVVYDRYGPPDVLRLVEVERPVPRPDEVLVRVKATTVNRTDTGIRQGAPFISRLVSGLLRPRWRILGSELAGVVEATGAAVTEFKAGDEVFGVNAWRLGAHAEFVCVREGGALALKPAGMSFEEAAAVCDGAILALNCLRPANLGRGRSILIYGASGSIGTAGVQLSRYFDADVTGVANTKNLELVRSLGADEVLNYTQEDFTINGQVYDVIFDAVGKLSFRVFRGSLKPGGIYLPTDHLQNVVLALWTARIGDKKVVFAIPPRYTKKDVVFLKGLIEEGKYQAVIDRRYPLEDVIQATRYVETQQKTGNVVLAVDSGQPPPAA